MNDEQELQRSQPEQEETNPPKEKRRNKRIQMRRGVFVFALVFCLLLGTVAGGGLLAALLRRAGMPRPSGDRVSITKEDYEDYVYLANTYDKIDYLVNMIDRNYYTDVDPDVLMEGAYRGIFDALDDPYSQYYTEEEYKDMLADMTGEFYGIGVQVTNKNGEIYVMSVLKDGPALKQGVKPGDVIIRVDGVNYDGASMDEAVAHMRGVEGTSVEVVMLREGNEMAYTFVRKKIVSETVTSKKLENNIGYIRISQFESETGKQFRLALKALERENVSGLVVDLRSNPGGMVNEAIKVADEFLPAAVVAYIEDQNGNRDEYTAKIGFTRLQTVFLCDENSASSSEIFLAAMKDYEVGTIIGTTTFGKGIIQQVADDYGDGSGFKITVLQYFSPNGNAIHKIGVEPDIVLDYKEGLTNEDYGDDGFLLYECDLQLQKAVEVLTQGR